MLKTYRKLSLWRWVRFKADVDISAGIGKCICTIFTKMRLWSVSVKPEMFRVKDPGLSTE